MTEEKYQVGLSHELVKELGDEEANDLQNYLEYELKVYLELSLKYIRRIKS